MKVYPRVVGYCNVAEVVAKGSSVTKYEVGNRILTFQSHRTAFSCPEDKVVLKIPESADLMAAATTYLFHLGYHALLRGDFQPGHNVAVLGLGTLGLTTVALASISGARVYALSNQPSSLELAAEFGARETWRKDIQDLRDRLNLSTGGTGIDLLVTSSGSWEDWWLALSLVRKGGKICVLGFPGRTEPIPNFNPLDSRFFYDNQLSLIACGYTPDYEISAADIRFTIKRNCQFLLELIMQGKLPAKRLISMTADWREIGKVYEALAGRKNPILTCILNWN
jgi:threonine dehydrogenase-like Zn-dependent dehydrogenase